MVVAEHSKCVIAEGSPGGVSVGGGGFGHPVVASSGSGVVPCILDQLPWSGIDWVVALATLFLNSAFRWRVVGRNAFSSGGFVCRCHSASIPPSLPEVNSPVKVEIPLHFSPFTLQLLDDINSVVQLDLRVSQLLYEQPLLLLLGFHLLLSNSLSFLLSFLLRFASFLVFLVFTRRVGRSFDLRMAFQSSLRVPDCEDVRAQ